MHVEPKWGDREISTIRQSEIAQWVAELTKVRSAQTFRRAIFVLSGVPAIAAREHVIARNPAVAMTLPAKRRNSPRYLAHSQVATLSSSAAQEQHAVMLELFAYSGSCWGKAVAIRVRHLNLLHRRSRLEDNAVIVKGEYEIGTPKSGMAREIPLPPHLVKRIARLCEGRTPDDFVFGDGTAPMPHPHAISGWFVKTVRSAQLIDKTIPAITPHDLRHTAASLAVSSGAHVKAVQRMLGHASATMTLDV